MPLTPTKVWVRLGTALVECDVIHARPDDYNNLLAKPCELLISGSESSLEYLAATGDWWLNKDVTGNWVVAEWLNEFLHEYWLNSTTATIPLHFTRKNALESYSFFCFEEEDYYAKRRLEADRQLLALGQTRLTNNA